VYCLWYNSLRIQYFYCAFEVILIEYKQQRTKGQKDKGQRTKDKGQRIIILNVESGKCEVIMKKPSYKKLWKLLIDRDLKKKDLQGLAGISSATIVKLSNHENVSMDILLKLCDALQVDVSDIVEFLDSSEDA